MSVSDTAKAMAFSAPNPIATLASADGDMAEVEAGAAAART